MTTGDVKAKALETLLELHPDSRARLLQKPLGRLVAGERIVCFARPMDQNEIATTGQRADDALRQEVNIRAAQIVDDFRKKDEIERSLRPFTGRGATCELNPWRVGRPKASRTERLLGDVGRK